MSHDDVIILFLSFGVLLASARILGEIARRFNQPAVMGELLAGILLGPTLLGALAPAVFAGLFPDTGAVPIAIEGITIVGITLFLLVAGLEVDLSVIFRQGKSAFAVSISGIVIPAVTGFALGWFGPMLFSGEHLGKGPEAGDFVFALFLATAMAISALPVIAKTLMDLNLYRSELGMTVIASAVFDDLLGWIIFAILLAMIGARAAEGGSIPQTIGLTLLFVAGMLTVGRWLLNRILPFVQAHMSWPGGVLGMAVALAMFAAALVEWIGVHAIFGAFIVGVALGDSKHLKERTRQTLEQFVTFIFAPLFFATVGLRVDFVANFDLVLVLVVLVIACAGKLLGCAWAARMSGMPKRESWAVGAAMNARGAMEIILALIALEVGLINEKLFVALVVMALATSVIAGPLMQKILKRKKPRRFTDYVGARSFSHDLKASNPFAAIIELADISGVTSISPQTAADAVIARERMFSTGISNGIAMPHARIKGLRRAQVAVGVSREGIDFNSPDGSPAHIICLILTPEEDHSLALELYRDIVGTLQDEQTRHAVLQVKNYTEFLALLASLKESEGHHDNGGNGGGQRTDSASAAT